MLGKSTFLGIDIGYEMLKLALVSKGKVKKAASVAMPEHIIKNGRIVSVETMAELIKTAMKQNDMRCKNAAVVLSDEIVFTRNIVMPQMSEEQLAINLPYEFSDYITEELGNYTFDYAMISTPKEMAEGVVEGQQLEETRQERKRMALTAVTIKTEILDDLKRMLRKAGLRLVKAAPVTCAYASLIRRMSKDRTKEYSILDIGYKSIRLYMYKGDVHQVTKEIELGMELLEQIIAEEKNVDVHVAHTYLMTNYEDCQTMEACRNFYTRIAVELMRAVNFYRFSNPDSQLADVYMTGGGAEIEPLRKAILEDLDLDIYSVRELVNDLGLHMGQCYITSAVGIALDE